MQLKIFQCLLFHKNYCGAMQSPRAMRVVQRRNVQWRGELLAMFPRPQPHKGLCKCFHHSFALLKKRHGTSSGLFSTQSIALFQLYINLAGLQFKQRWPVQHQWPRCQTHGGVNQQYLVKTKFYDPSKDEGSPQDYRCFAVSFIKAGKTRVTPLPGSLLEAFGETLIIGFNIADTDVGEGS